MQSDDTDNARVEQARKASQFLTTVDAATYVCLSRRTLEKMRTTGNGPVYRKHGRYVRYHTGAAGAPETPFPKAKRPGSRSREGEATQARQRSYAGERRPGLIR